MVAMGIQLLAALLLVRAFAPRLGDTMDGAVSQALRTIVVVRVPDPAPSPSPTATRHAGDAGAPAHGDPARAVAVPRAAAVAKPVAAPTVAGEGDAIRSGARLPGAGSGAAGSGAGPGAGGSGTGAGGGQRTQAVRITGDIRSAADYPRSGRDLRIGSAVTIDLRIGTDGRVSDCRIVEPSRDPAADRITCDLATRRFRFRPATDASGEPVEATYRWQQRWFY